MEIFSVFASEKRIIEQLVNTFLDFETTIPDVSEELGEIDFENGDTIYLEFRNDESSRIYLHLDTLFEEEIFNYEENEIAFVKRFFKNKEIHVIDISYNNQLLLYKLLTAFTQSLNSGDDMSVLFSDPFKGFIEINGIGGKVSE